MDKYPLPSYTRSYDSFDGEYAVLSYIHFLEECDEIALHSARKPSLSDYDAVVTSQDY